MDAAIDEIAANGIDGASYNRIIERSGLSKGVVYYYFENKESLYKTVLEEVERQFIAAVGTLRIPNDKNGFWEACDMYYTRALKFAVSNLRIVDVARRFFWPSCSSSPDSGPVFESLQRAERWTKLVLRKGQELGALRQDVDFELLRNLVYAAGHTMDSWLFDKLRNEPDAVDIERFARFALDMFKRILSPKGLGESC